MVEETENNVDEETEETSANNPIPEIDSKIPNDYPCRAAQQNNFSAGATPRVDADMRKQKPTRVAMREIKNKKVNFEILEIKL